MTQSFRAGLVFPVGRIGRYIREKCPHLKVGKTGPVFMAAVIEYLCAEILEIAGENS